MSTVNDVLTAMSQKYDALAVNVAALSARLNGVIDGMPMKERNLLDTMRSSIAAAMKEQTHGYIASAGVYPTQVGADGVYRIGQTNKSYDGLDELDLRLDDLEAEVARMNARSGFMPSANILRVIQDVVERVETLEINANAAFGEEAATVTPAECGETYDLGSYDTICCNLPYGHLGNHSYSWGV